MRLSVSPATPSPAQVGVTVSRSRRRHGPRPPAEPAEERRRRRRRRRKRRRRRHRVRPGSSCSGLALLTAPGARRGVGTARKGARAAGRDSANSAGCGAPSGCRAQGGGGAQIAAQSAAGTRRLFRVLDHRPPPSPPRVHAAPGGEAPGAGRCAGIRLGAALEAKAPYGSLGCTPGH